MLHSGVEIKLHPPFDPERPVLTTLVDAAGNRLFSEYLPDDQSRRMKLARGSYILRSQARGESAHDQRFVVADEPLTLR